MPVTVRDVLGGLAGGDDDDRRRGDDDDPFDNPEALKHYKRQAARRDRERNAESRKLYEEGKRDQRRRTKRKPARRRSRRSPAARAARQLTAPVYNQATSGLRTLGLALAVVALYLFLENAQFVGGFIGSIGSALEWLASPVHTIPGKAS